MPLPQIRADSISDLKVQVQKRREALLAAIGNLDDLIEDLDRADAALRGDEGSQFWFCFHPLRRNKMLTKGRHKHIFLT